MSPTSPFKQQLSFSLSAALSLSLSLSLSETMHSLSWKAIAIATALLHLCISMDVESYLPDKISNLPGQPQVSFQQFSGYITVDERKQRALFYYFAEAEMEPSIRPLVLWLNGGPGCSSVGVGAFSENGPFRPSGEILVRNEHSWNKEANMLYLETPAGVGFSYSTDTSYYVGVDDKKTARDNLVFLQRWFVKFPQYKSRDLIITGESYAGHYVPQLAQLMIEFNKKEKLFNLKGIALGNPVLEFATDFNSRAEFFWSHGLISDSTYKIFTSSCNYSRYVSEYYRSSVSPVCSRVMSQVNKETSRFVDSYDVTLDVCISSVLSQSMVLSQQVTERIDVCVEDETKNYLNRKDVQNALHARLMGVAKWEACSRYRQKYRRISEDNTQCTAPYSITEAIYNSSESSFFNLDYDVLNVEIPTISIVGSIVESGIPALIYSGDQDSVIPLTGSRKLVHGLANELGLNTTVPYRVWFEGQQVGGWTQVYGNILSFATVRGASHETLFSQPERSLVLFKAFLEGRPLPETF